MKWFRIFLIVVFVSGLSIVLIPDSGRPVVRINHVHGPSLIDLVGLTLMLLSWAASTFLIIRERKNIIAMINLRLVYLLLGLYALSISAIGFSLVNEKEFILWFFVITAALINISFIFFEIQAQKRRE